jgi:uncharacterized protein YjeT (DUF2065 family)
MIWFLFVIGLFWVIAGTLMIFSTGLMKEYYAHNVKVWDHRVFSPLALVAGVLFFLAAPSSSQPMFITVLGLLSLAKGCFLLIGPYEKVRRMMNWFLDASDQVYRIWGASALALGIAVLITIVR